MARGREQRADDEGKMFTQSSLLTAHGQVFQQGAGAPRGTSQ